MSCTTILVGKNASYDGSTIVARNEDSPSGKFTPKKFCVVQPSEQPRHYKSILSHVKLTLPNHPQRYTSLPDAVPVEGIWAEAGVNEYNVSMSATETLTTNPRVLGADPLVELVPAQKKSESSPYTAEKPGGIGEEDMVTLVLPYIRTARDGVKLLGGLLERYGTYENNGIAFSDVNEIWWLETVGGHHWIAKRVPDNAYVTMPNQLGIDSFDLDDAFGEQKEHMCSEDLVEFMAKAHLDLTPREDVSAPARVFNPREAFGSNDDSDRVYNTPRAWDIQRSLNPHTCTWEGTGADFTPEANNIPWSRVPEHLITIEDVKYVLSLHFQGTPYDPYGHSTPADAHRYRPIGVNRNGQLSVVQLRPYAPKQAQAVQWFAFSSNVFNALIPQYTNVNEVPTYFSNTTAQVSTESFYWANRLVAAMADAHFGPCTQHIERYQLKVGGLSQQLLNETDAQLETLIEETEGAVTTDAKATNLLEAANEHIAAMVRTQTDDLLDKVLFTASLGMKNAFSRSDN